MSPKHKRSRKKRPARHDRLNARQERFVSEYLVDLDASAAYQRAGYKATGNAAAVCASKLLTVAKIALAVQAAKVERLERVHLKQDEILEHWTQIAQADVNDLIEFRRTCCRYCHGADHLYQRTVGEMARDRIEWALLEAKAKKPLPAFSEQGGIGYDARRDPHPDCPECFGEGVGRAFLKDTRKLPESARRLYAGVKVTKDGLEVKMRDQDGALTNLAKHSGMFPNRQEHTGKDGKPIEHVHVSLEDWKKEREKRLAAAEQAFSELDEG